MRYLDVERLAALDPHAYQTRDPYPWVNPVGLLHQDAYQSLVENLPPFPLFERIYGKERAHGQRSHDRYALEYEPGLALPTPWQEFIAELRGATYRRLLSRLVGVRDLELRFHWHWATTGASVSPHCDNRRKLGSHIFYLNTDADWQPQWGGETVVLGDGGRFRRSSAPDFGDFDAAHPAVATGNRSLVFTRRGNSWHGVREIRCPEGAFRKVFIVVLNRPRLGPRIRRVVGRRPAPGARAGHQADPRLQRASPNTRRLLVGQVRDPRSRSEAEACEAELRRGGAPLRRAPRSEQVAKMPC